MLGERSLKCKCIAVVVIEEKAAIRQQVLANCSLHLFLLLRPGFLGQECSGSALLLLSHEVLASIVLFGLRLGKIALKLLNLLALIWAMRAQMFKVKLGLHMLDHQSHSVCFLFWAVAIHPHAAELVLIARVLQVKHVLSPANEWA